MRHYYSTEGVKVHSMFGGSVGEVVCSAGADMFGLASLQSKAGENIFRRRLLQAWFGVFLRITQCFLPDP